MTAAEKAARICDAAEGFADDLIAGRLAEQRHQLLDPPVPPETARPAGRPLTARQFFAALDAGYSLPRAPWEG